MKMKKSRENNEKGVKVKGLDCKLANVQLIQLIQSLVLQVNYN